MVAKQMTLNKVTSEMPIFLFYSKFTINIIRLTNCMCQFRQATFSAEMCPQMLTCILGRCFSDKIKFKLMDSVKQTTRQGWVGFIQSAEGLNKTD